MWGWLVLAAGALAWGSAQADAQRRRTLANYRTRFGGSVEVMLAEAAIDRDEVRRLRGSGRPGLIRATRLVRRQLDVPLSAAAEFARRV